LGLLHPVYAITCCGIVLYSQAHCKKKWEPWLLSP
jgi:hypothetical protein